MMICEAELALADERGRAAPADRDDDEFYANLLFESMVTTTTFTRTSSAADAVPDTDGTAELTRALYAELRERKLRGDRASDDELY